MKTEDLIARLATEAAPVQPVPSVAARLFRWAAVAVLTLVAVVAVVGPREDLWTRLTNPAFSGSIGLVGGFTVTSAWVALALSVPDDRRPALLPVGPLLLVAAWGAWLVVSLANSGPMLGRLLQEPVYPNCVWQILLTSVVPVVALGRLVRQAAPVQPRWTGVLAAVAALGVGAVSVAIVCPYDAAAHLVTWHLVPVVALAGLGILLGGSWLDRLQPVTRR